jgi:(p)ppGpp synthase/HD superfamily hydrolase
MENNKILGKAMSYALKAHEGQTYDIHSYGYHLVSCYLIGSVFTSDQNILSAIWLHDVLEDTDTTYDELKKEFGDKIADLVFKVTDGDGKNRKERKEKMYQKIGSDEKAIFVKLCDRVANVMYSKKSNRNLFKMYVKEHDSFYNALYNETHSDQVLSLWDKLDNIIKSE